MTIYKHKSSIPHKQPPRSRRTTLPSQWLAFFRHPDNKKRCNKSLCTQMNINYNAARSRYKKWKNSGSPLIGDPSSIPGCGNERYRGRRILSDEAENEVAQFIRSSMINVPRRAPITNNRIRPFLHQAIPSISRRITRSFRPPRPAVFGNKFMHRFKRDHNFSRVALPVRTRSTPITPTEEKQAKKLQNTFYKNVKTAINEFGSDWVFNMDETPASIAPSRVHTIHEKKKQKDESIDAGGDMKSMTTTVVTVSASGKKLPLMFITSGTTIRSTEKFLGLVDDPHRVMHTSSGWMNTDMMVWYLNNIIKPHTNGRPCCMILDHYGSHAEDDQVDALAEELNIWLVFVPESRTYDLQPLDVGVNAILKKKRDQKWMNQRINDPLIDMSVGFGAKFMVESYDELTVDTIKKSFVKGCNLDINNL